MRYSLQAYATRVLFLVMLSGITLLEAKAQISVLSPLSDDREAAPGSVYTGVINIKNETQQPQQVKIYPSDYLFFADGSNVFEEPGEMPRSNAKWIRFSPSLLTLPPRAVLPVSYEVTVPADTLEERLQGSYWSVLFVESVARGSAESTLPGAEADVQHRTKSKMRYGLQVATHISGGNPGAVAFEGVEVAGEEKERQLEVDIVNTGEMMIKPSIWVEFYDEEGNVHHRVTGTSQRIYPGTSVRQCLDVSDLERGTYEALIVVDAGSASIFGAQVSVSI